MNSKLLSLILLLVILSLNIITAQEHKYTFEKAEELTPLIEWRDYGPDAFEEAISENKPIFLLLTAPSWCYWCQVYESEDYLFNSVMVEVVNSKTIPVYVDADKRQDLTRQYLEGGWPSTTIFTPDRERLFGYSGVRPVANMIANIDNAYNHVQLNDGEYIVKYDYEIRDSVQLSDPSLLNYIEGYHAYTLRVYDGVHGGFGQGQKFPRGRTLDISLDRYEGTGDERYLDLVISTLENQYTEIDELSSNYNLFDPVEGGFHRYGTQRDWTPPHYEKMLYDNAKLLRAYYHLMQIEENSLVKEVVEKTDSFIQREYYDSQNGGFYGNSDVHGEDAYYGKNPRPLPKPRVEETKYTDWNVEAILTYLYLYEDSGNIVYRDMAVKSLDFYLDMYDGDGAYHYLRDGEKGVQGNLLDNSYLLLVFVEGYDIIGDDRYLDAANDIADYSLDNLYDWNVGGFFERHSRDVDSYAPGENILLSKPANENGIIAYALLRLYGFSDDIKYLNAGMKTVSLKILDAGVLDGGYYFVKASELIFDNGLINDYNRFSEEVAFIEAEELDGFWLNVLLDSQEKGFFISEEGLEKLEGPILLLVIVSFIAGLISIISPCSLPILPAYFAYTMKSTGRNVKGMTVSFFLGLSVIFIMLGMSASFVGNLLKSNLTIFSQAAGLIIIVLGLGMILGKGFSGFNIRYKPSGYLSSFLFGGVFGLAWTPCVGPILVAILILAGINSSVFTGGVLLFSYAIGLSVPLVLFSSYLGRINKESKFWRFIKGKVIIIEYSEGKRFMIHSTSLISGVLFIILGWLIFSGQMFIFNQYVSDSGFQKWLFGVEERVLGWLN